MRNQATPPADRPNAVTAAAAYALLTALFTWPLVRGLARDIPGDYGDPLLNIWILAWDATHMLTRDSGWWNANIFHPHVLTLGYSEHLAGQAIQILPLYGLTGNPILCYNVLFLSTFVLSGLGVFLFVRELTGNARAAFVAGLAFAFAPYRIASLPHIQVLSSAWMPLTLFAFRRYIATRRALPLAGAVAAWLLQNLSCGYYLLFFSPVVVFYLMWELSARSLWTDARLVGWLALACALVGAATAPFVLPYLELRRLGFNPRSIVETQKFSADVYGYLTADPNLRFWGPLARAWPKAESALFPGITVSVLAIIGATRYMVRLKADTTSEKTAHDTFARTGGRTRVAVSVVLVATVAIVLVLLSGGSIRLPWLKITSLERALVIAAAAGVAALAISRDTRRTVAAWLRTPAGCFVVITLFAIVMSFGPQIHARDRVVLDTSLYDVFYRWVPGFDGLRVPARFGMIAALGLSVLAGLGLRGRRAAPVAAALILFESYAAPLPLNQNPPDYKRPGLAALADLSREPPAVYSFVRKLPAGAAVLELPLGEPAFDVRYMYYSTRHWRPLVNGYTGGQPADYELLDVTLQDLFTRPDRAWTALRGSSATHVIVHESFYQGDRGPQVSRWLRSRGAFEIAAYGPDRVFLLK